MKARSYAVRRGSEPVTTLADGEAPAWRTNPFRCGYGTSHPRRLACSPVDVPVPAFHRPEFFGTREFVP